MTQQPHNSEAHSVPDEDSTPSLVHRGIRDLDNRGDVLVLGSLLCAAGLGVAVVSEVVDVISPLETSPFTIIGMGAVIVGAAVSAVGAILE